jgi:hypothetical protein
LLHLLAHAVQPLQHPVEVGLLRRAIDLRLNLLERRLHSLLAIFDGPFQLLPQVRRYALLCLAEGGPAGLDRPLQEPRTR